MVANLAHLGKATRFGHGQLQSELQMGDDGAPERHPDSALVHGLDVAADSVGEGLFNKAMIAGIGGWVAQKTVARLVPSWAPKIASVTYAPMHALEKTSFANFSMHNLKANYWELMAGHGEKHAKHALKKHPGLYDSYKQKAAHYGKPVIANAKWEGIGKLPKYMMNRGMFSTVMAAGLALGAAVSIFKGSKEAADDLTDIQAVAKDLTGEAITADQFFLHPQTLSPIMRDMRENLITHLKHDEVAMAGGLAEKAGFAAMGGPVAHLAGGFLNAPMVAMMGGMAIGHAAHELAPSEDFAHNYLKVKDMLDAGRQVPAELYGHLMAASSAEVRRIGLNSAQAQAIATQYAAEQISAKALVEEVYAHTPFVERAKRVAEAIESEEQGDAVEAQDTAEVQRDVEEETPTEKSSAGKDVPEPANENRAPKKSALLAAQHDGKMQQAVGMGRGGAA